MRFELLDHGYLELVETWGSDQSIIEAARMSTNKGFLGWGPLHSKECPHGHAGFVKAHEKMDCCPDAPGDEKLLRYLWENAHSTPFEMAGLTVEVKAPIMVFREWHRHRVPFGYNEMSARYTPLPDENYVPSLERLFMGGGHLTKQAGTTAGAAELTKTTALQYRERLIAMYVDQENLYREALAAGVPKELARLHLPVGRYSRMRATGNLRGWLAFMKLRSAPNAQYEIRVYAEALGKVIAEKFPRTWELFAEKRA
jgi:thymidylate synthase (FAD)